MNTKAAIASGVVALALGATAIGVMTKPSMTRGECMVVAVDPRECLKIPGPPPKIRASVRARMEKEKNAHAPGSFGHGTDGG